MKPLPCPLKIHCIECDDLEKQADAYTCPIFRQWFKAQQNYSLKSHGQALAANPF